MSKKSTNKSTIQEFSARTMCGSAKVWMIVAMIEALFIFGYMGYRSMIQPLGINKITSREGGGNSSDCNENSTTKQINKDTNDIKDKKDTNGINPNNSKKIPAKKTDKQ